MLIRKEATLQEMKLEATLAESNPVVVEIAPFMMPLFMKILARKLVGITYHLSTFKIKKLDELMPYFSMFGIV